jgi:hypothetical protein
LCKSGAHAVLTPTGYIGAADVDSLAAVLDAAPARNSRAVVSLPLDITWATYEWIETLIDMVASTPTPKAMMFTSHFGAGIAVKEILANLRLIVSEVPQVGLFRSDLTVLDLMAHGALAGSIGGGAASRRLGPPTDRNSLDRARDEEDGPFPEVLVSELVSYIRADMLVERFRGTQAPSCHCRYCGGQALTRFTSRAEWRDARLHGFAVWTEWLPGLLSDASLTRRQLSWARLCQHGAAAFGEFGSPDRGAAIAPGQPLLFWAGDVSLAPAVAARLRSRQARAAREADVS